MRRRLRKILCGLNLLLAVATVGLWIYVAFYASQRFTWQGQREYSLNLGMYAYGFDILRCKQQAGVVTGDIMRMLSEPVVVPMRGVEHYSSIRRGHGFHFERVQSWPAENSTRLLPPPVQLAGGGTLRTELRVEGVSFGVPYWFVVAFCLVQPSWLTSRAAATHLQTRKRRWRAERHLCMSCGYDLRATPDRCPECGTVPTTIEGPPQDAHCV